MCTQTGGRTTIYEWDADIPAFEVLHDEALKARRIRETLAPAPLVAAALEVADV